MAAFRPSAVLQNRQVAYTYTLAARRAGAPDGPVVEGRALRSIRAILASRILPVQMAAPSVGRHVENAAPAPTSLCKRHGRRQSQGEYK